MNPAFSMKMQSRPVDHDFADQFIKDEVFDGFQKWQDGFESIL